MATKHSIKPADIFVLTGELSGDILGHGLLKDLSKKFTIEGVLGPNLRKLNIKEILDMDKLNFMGFSKPLASIRNIISSFNLIKNHILKTNPKVVLLIDLPDINLYLAKKIRQKGFKGKIIQVVCPTIWAWRPKRKATLEKYFDHLLCLFPFEKDLFKDSPLKVSYIGHPLSSIEARASAPKKKIIAIFPGSRKQEVNRFLPQFLKACENFKEFEIHVSVAKESLIPSVQEHLKDTPSVIRMADEKDDLIKECTYALAKNGTINLELALFHVPQVSCYSVSFIERFILEKFFSLYLTHYSLPNIILKKRVIPELIGPMAKTSNIEKELTNLLYDPYIENSMKSDYERLSSKIKYDPTHTGSDIIERLLL